MKKKERRHEKFTFDVSKKEEGLVCTLHKDGRNFRELLDVKCIREILLQDVYNRFGKDLLRIANFLEKVLSDEESDKKKAVHLILGGENNGFNNCKGVDKAVWGIRDRLIVKIRKLFPKKKTAQRF